MNRRILLLWPSFIIAVLATAVFFSIFDPAELTLHGRMLFDDKVSAYSTFLLISWLFGAFNTAIVLFLERSTRELNGFAPHPMQINDNEEESFR